MSTQVQSQTKLLPRPNRKMVIPPGRQPSPLSKPGGSSTDGIPALWRARLTKSFIAECLGWRPALNLHAKPWRPLASINLPHLQEWGWHTSAPILRAIDILRVLAQRKQVCPRGQPARTRRVSRNLSRGGGAFSKKNLKHWVNDS